jgi:hypothetical protein
MHKKTKGYTLLLLLVLTGLAGRQSTTTITSKERRFLIEELKDSRAGVQKSIKGLNEKQLAFKPSKEAWSINECLQHIVLAENNLWNITNASLKQTSNSEIPTGTQLEDAQVLTMLVTRDKKLEAPKSFKPAKAKWRDTEEILEAFKDNRADLIKYAKTSTDDMRNHVLEMAIGTVDVYQMLLYISAHTKHHTLQIEEVKANPAFPK